MSNASRDTAVSEPHASGLSSEYQAEHKMPAITSLLSLVFLFFFFLFFPSSSLFTVPSRRFFSLSFARLAALFYYYFLRRFFFINCARRTNGHGTRASLSFFPGISTSPVRFVSFFILFYGSGNAACARDAAGMFHQQTDAFLAPEHPRRDPD